MKKLSKQAEKIVIKETTNKLRFKKNRKLAWSTVGTPDYIAPKDPGETETTIQLIP